MGFRVLGTLEVDAGGAPIPLTSARQRALLAALLLSPGRVVSVDRLVDALWGGDPPAHPANAVQNVVARLRRTLRDDGTTIRTQPPGYRLVIDPSQVDAHRFEVGHRRARALLGEDPHGAAAALDEALREWRGPAFAEHADGFAQAEAARLEELHGAAQEDRVVAALAMGAGADAVARAQALCAAEPLRERPVELLLRALVAEGRVGDALAAFQRHRALVDAELGLDPSAALREVEEQILRGELHPTAFGPAGPAPPRPGAPAPPGQPAPSTAADPSAGSGIPGAPVPRHHHRGLPWRPSALLGRDRELSDVLRAAGTHRVVTIVGTGGVGKTRLCLEAAHQLAGEGNPVWWVDLVPIAADGVVHALAHALGIDVAEGSDPAGALCAALGAHRGVVCIDNAEHVLAPVALLVERVVAETADLRVFVTSRVHLGLDGEAVVPVRPLPLPSGAERGNPAVALFVDRWLRGAATAPADDDVALIATVCRRLDGLPLAIELAAAKAATLGLPAVADRLADRLDLLSGGRRTAAERHRTLRAVVDWSHALLSPTEALLFARLAAFPRTFTLEQAEAVCGHEPLPRAAIAPLLSQLVEQSLVQATGGRFGLLETLHHYAQDRLNAGGEERDVRRRHAEDTAHRLGVLRASLWTPEEAAAAANLTALVDDLHAAWSYAVVHDRDLAVVLAADVHDFASSRQRPDLLEWGLVVAGWDDVDHPRLPDALATATAAAMTEGRFADAARLASRAVTTAGGEDEPAASLAVELLGDLAMQQGELELAAARYLRAADLHAARGRHVEGLFIRLDGHQAAIESGRTADRVPLDRLTQRAEAVGNPSLLAQLHLTVAELTPRSDAERAARSYRAAVAHGRAAGNGLLAGLAQTSLLELVAVTEPLDRARAAFAAALDQWEEIGNVPQQWRALLNLVLLLHRFGADPDAALLGGAVLTAHRRGFVAPADERRLADVLASVRGELGTAAAEAAISRGAAMALAAAVARARAALQALEASSAVPGASAGPATGGADDSDVVPA